MATTSGRALQSLLSAIRRYTDRAGDWLRSSSGQLARRLCVTAALTAIASHSVASFAFMRDYEARWLDFVSAALPAQPSGDVVVVDITQQDYDDPALYRSHSPLDPMALAATLRGVASHRPSVVVLDVLLYPSAGQSDSIDAGRLALYYLIDSLATVRMPIVILGELPGVAESRTESRATSYWRLLLAGGSAGHIYAADGRLRIENGIVRTAHFEVPSNGSDEASPTLLTVVATLLKSRQHESTVDHAHGHGEMSIRWSGAYSLQTAGMTPYRIQSSQVLGPTTIGTHTLLTDKIVLIGGSYTEARDTFLTPIGPMAGVHVWAEAIGTLIKGDAPRHAPIPLTLMLETCLGIVGGLTLIRFGPGLGVVLLLAVTVPLSLLLSFASFGVAGLFVGFLPSVAAVHIHYQIEIHDELRKLRRIVAAHE